VDDLGIPVRGLFLFMVLFVVLIGPVNFYWLTRTRRRIWMLWTVPAASFVTCAALFGYMMLSEGWHGHIRATSVTVLDEQSQRAATVGWIGYYSPTTPSDGFRFSDDTELTPHLLSDRTYRRSNKPHTIDWTNGQHLDSGWIDAKVPAHFMVRRNEKRLERMLVRKQGDGTPAIVNGLPSDVSAIWMATLDGSVWTATNVRAGAEARMQSEQGKLAGKGNALREAFAKSWIDLAADMEKTPLDYLRPGCYLAVVEDAPFLEPGMEQTQTRNMRSIVVGILKEPL
jgi:hypothetical protein